MQLLSFEYPFRGRRVAAPPGVTRDRSGWSWGSTRMSIFAVFCPMLVKWGAVGHACLMIPAKKLIVGQIEVEVGEPPYTSTHRKRSPLSDAGPSGGVVAFLARWRFLDRTENAG
jgi:hypothetical protein